MLSPEQVATILDTEGCITALLSHGGLPYPRVSVGMTDPVYIKELAAQFGGSVNLRKRSANNKDIWKWELCGRPCATILEYCLSYLKIKHEQANCIITLCSVLPSPGGWQRTSEHDRLLRWTLFERLKKLNRKGKTVDAIIKSLENQSIDLKDKIGNLFEE